MTTSSLLLIGCGKMGGALLARWQENLPGAFSDITVVEPHAPSAHHANTQFFKNLEALPANILPSAIVLAVKPDMLAGMLPDLRTRFGANLPLIISIAAGKPVSFYKTQLGEHAHVVRAMPNTPAMVGKGVTALFAENTLPESQRHIASTLMQAVGSVLWLEDETQMHAVTAISGSGPAYVFLFLQNLADAAVAAGLAENTARQLAVETLAGSAALAGASHESFETLRKNVTSPGGTTEAALSLLIGEWEETIKKAVNRAIARSKEMAG